MVDLLPACLWYIGMGYLFDEIQIKYKYDAKNHEKNKYNLIGISLAIIS